jgi:enterochelin esterase family protein
MNALLARAKQEGTPLIDGDQATFVWEGVQAPILMNDLTGWWDVATAQTLTETAPGFWTTTLTLPADAYLEYCFVVDLPPGEDWGAYRVLDPLNPRTKSNGMGDKNNYFYMPEARPTPLVRLARGIPRGRLTRHQVPTHGLAEGKRRRVMLYQPPVDEPVPLLLVLDGYDYVQQAKLPAIVDNLLAQGRIRPFAMLLPQNARTARMVEYGCTDITHGFFAFSLYPLAQRHLNLLDVREQPGCHAIMGASMGGLMALYLALRNPDIFGTVISQAGCFSLEPHDMIVYDLVRAGVAPELRLWLDWGEFDSLRPTNERMLALLRDQSRDVTARNYNAGHNFFAWRDALPEALETMFGP